MLLKFKSTPADLPPGPRMVTPIQSAWWATRPASFLRHCRSRYGETFTVRLTDGGQWVFVSAPQDVRTVFTQRSSQILSGATHELLEPLFGARSVHLIDGEDHLRQRRLLLPPLHGDYLRHYGELVIELTEAEITRWPVDQEFAILPHMRRITLEVIMRGIFGFGSNEGRRVRECIDAMLRMTMGELQVVTAAVLNPRLFRFATRSRLFSFRRTMDALEAVLLAEISKRRREHGADSRDMLSMLIDATGESGRSLNDIELKDNLVTLVVAGHETTATALTWALHTLARSPEALSRLVAELESDAYLEAAVQETLRLHPSVPLSMRRLVEPLELQDATLPAGTNVAVCIYLLHRSDAYEDPDAFRPKRFEGGHPDSYTWAPFGGGTRRCVGASLAALEMKLMLRTILANRRLVTQRGRNEAVASLALRPSRGGRVTLQIPDR